MVLKRNFLKNIRIAGLLAGVHMDVTAPAMCDSRGSRQAFSKGHFRKPTNREESLMGREKGNRPTWIFSRENARTSSRGTTMGNNATAAGPRVASPSAFFARRLRGGAISEFDPDWPLLALGRKIEKMAKARRGRGTLGRGPFTPTTY